MSKNKFKSVEVFTIMKQGEYGSNDNDVIQFYDTTTAKVVLEIGTRNTSDYYPCFVATWSPENLCLNQNK